MFVIFSVFYILVAAAMTVLILMQRGEGANAGASFGGGSSGTMFGARGSATFMSRLTYGLFAVFIIMSLGMAIYLTHTGAPKPTNDLGVMSGVTTGATRPAPAKAAQPVPAVPQPATAVPRATQQATPATTPTTPKAGTGSELPTASSPAKEAAKAGTKPAGTKSGSSGSDKH